MLVSDQDIIALRPGEEYPDWKAKYLIPQPMPLSVVLANPNIPLADRVRWGLYLVSQPVRLEVLKRLVELVLKQTNVTDERCWNVFNAIGKQTDEVSWYGLFDSARNAYKEASFHLYFVSSEVRSACVARRHAIEAAEFAAHCLSDYFAGGVGNVSDSKMDAVIAANAAADAVVALTGFGETEYAHQVDDMLELIEKEQQAELANEEIKALNGF